MKRLYLSSHDISDLPKQECMRAGERRELYIDGKFISTVRAVPSNARSCKSCYLNINNGTYDDTGLCRIPVAYISGPTGHPMHVGVGCCGYNTIIESVGDMMEEL